MRLVTLAKDIYAVYMRIDGIEYYVGTFSSVYDPERVQGDR